MESYIRAILSNLSSLDTFILRDLWNHISNGHTAIIILVSIAILLSIVTIIRQQKIMKMLQDLTPPREEEASAKETE